MNKFLLIIFILLSLIMLSLQKNIKNPKEYLDLSHAQNIKNNEIIEKINENCIKIKNLYADLTINQFPITLKGFIVYEKPQKFRMSCDSILRKEIEIGSNNKQFWFWSSNIKPKALYYCDYESIEKTRLRKIFYPKLLKTFLGIDELSNCEIKKDKDIYYVLENFNISDESLIKITIIKNGKIIAHKLCKNNEVLLEVKIIEFYENVPKKIKIKWLEEDVEQEWTLDNIKINKHYDKWQMPEYKQKINLENY